MLAAQTHDRPARSDRRLRVAGIDPELGFGGGEAQVLGLALELIRRGHRADLFCDPRGRLFDSARRGSVTCYPLPIRNSIDLRAALRLRRMLGAGRYDVIHFHTARAHALAPFAGGLARVRVVTRRMDYRPNRLFAPWLYNHAVEGVAAISEGVAEVLSAAGVKRSRVVVIPSGIDESRFRPPSADERAAARVRWGIKPEELAIGTVGALEPRKGHRVMLEALATIAGDREHSGIAPRLRWLVAGDGSMRGALAVAAGRMQLAERISFLGHLDDPRELLWALDLFVLPSLKEGLGVALLEAMGCGLTVIASDVGGAGAAVAGDAGIAVEPGSASALAYAIAEVGGSEEMRRARSAAARARTLERFTLASSAEATLKFYFNSLENAGQGA